LFFVFHFNKGFPPKPPFTSSDWIILGISIILFLLPFSTRVRIGNAIEFERKINEVKESVTDFKEETRSSLSLIAATVTTISNVSSTVNVSLPGLADLTAARKGIEEISTGKTHEDAQEVRQELLLDDESIIMPLARTRIRIEQLLRQLLQKHITVSNADGKDIKFWSAKSLFRDFLDSYPGYESLYKPFDYVNRVCNAAIHGQKVPKEEADEALNLGAEIIAVLSNITNSN
jgi:hypothetical protein